MIIRGKRVNNPLEGEGLFYEAKQIIIWRYIDYFDLEFINNKNDSMIPPNKEKDNGQIELVIEPSPPKESFLFRGSLYGEQLSGKTSILRRLTKDEFAEQYEETRSIEWFMSKVFITGRDKDKSVKLMIQDIPPMRIIKNFNCAPFRNLSFTLLVYDVASRKSFEALSIWEDWSTQNAFKEKCQLYVIGNKTDELREV